MTKFVQKSFYPKRGQQYYNMSKYGRLTASFYLKTKNRQNSLFSKIYSRILSALRTPARANAKKTKIKMKINNLDHKVAEIFIKLLLEHVEEELRIE